VADPAPTRLASFRVLEKLGQGGMGVVYKAYDETLGRVVAVKLLPAALADEADRRARLLREARSAAAATHANIATLYEVREHEGRVLLVMEYVEGRTLAAVLDGGALPVPEALRIARAIARGLARAHERGIVHRDLKPENVMVGPDGEVKILDFGLAKLRESADGAVIGRAALEQGETEAQVTKEGVIVGTPGYMSPEQGKAAAVDSRTDVFAFGAVLYEMLTGQRAFRGETALDVLIAVSRDEPEPASRLNPSVTPGIQAILDRCLAKDPAARYADARALVAALDDVLPSTSSGSAAPARTASHAPQKRARAWLPLVAALLATFALLAVVRGRRAPVPRHETHSASAPVPTAITELPPPKTSVRAPAAEYAAATQSYRSGSVAVGSAHLQRAVELDPTFAAAHLLLAAVGTEEKLESAQHVSAAAAHRADLSARDAELLSALQGELLQTQPDWAVQSKRWSALLDEYPGDAALALFAADRIYGPGHEAEGERILDRALAIDPKFMFAYALKAEILIDGHHLDEALATVARCLALEPSAASCLHRRADVEQARGQCAALVEDARSMIAIEPGGTAAYEFFANGLASTNAPTESVALALRRQAELQFDPSMKDLLRQLIDAFPALYEGDFAALDRFVPAWNAWLATAPSNRDASGVVEFEGHALEQMGHPERAVAVYEAYANRAAAMFPDHMIDWRVAAYVALRRAHRLSPEAFRAKLTQWQDEARPIGTEQTLRLWTFIYLARSAESPDEAREALAALEGEPRAFDWQEMGLEQWPLGHALRLVGRGEEAEPYLRRAAAACFEPWSLYWHQRAEDDLAQVLEAKHDVAGACAANGAILARWGRARPLSVLARSAATRSAKLRCAAAP
jgi:serine/threonine-protein kinase